MTQTKEGIRDAPWFKPSVLFVLFIIAYWVPLRAIVMTWYNNEDYSYGFLIPLISAYFFWEQRKEINKTVLKSSWKVLPVLIFFVLLSLYGILGSSGNISMPAIPILIILFTGFCFGIDALKRLVLPLGFLVFMIPVPPVIERHLGIFLKAISSRMGGTIINIFNIPVHVTGNVIDLGVTQLQVVDACSGMRYLFALLALGVVYANFFERAMWKRVVVVLSTLPIAVITNGLRIGITGILTDKYGARVAEGFFHGFSGWTLFMAAFAFLFVIGRMLAFFPPKSSLRKGGKDNPGNDGTTGKDNKTVVHDNINHAFYTAIGILVVVGLLSMSTKALPAVMIKDGLSKFPVEFAEWQGRSKLVDPEIIIASGAEESYSGNYKGSTGKAISLYIGYRSTAFLANENFFHSPTVCLPASGMQTVEETTRIIDNVPQFGRLKVSRLVMEHMGNRQLVYFWFQTKDKATHDKNVNRFHLALHAIKRDNTHDLFIRPITPVYPGEKVEDAEKRMDRFVREMMAALLQFLKERQYVGR